MPDLTCLGTRHSEFRLSREVTIQEHQSLVFYITLPFATSQGSFIIIFVLLFLLFFQPLKVSDTATKRQTGVKNRS